MNYKMIEIIPIVELNMINETLSRIGIANKKKKIIYPSCYLYKNIDGKYFICHFKELFLLNLSKSGYSNISEEDLLRRDSIIKLLMNWKMIEVIDELSENTIFAYVLPHSQKKLWRTCHKINTQQ